MDSNQPSEIRPTILLVDKDESTRNLYHRELRRTFRVIVCQNDEEALHFAGTEHADVLIFGLRPPFNLGWELLHRLQKIMPDVETPIVIYSGVEPHEFRETLPHATLLVQPVLPAVLNETIRQKLQSIGWHPSPSV